MGQYNKEADISIDVCLCQHDTGKLTTLCLDFHVQNNCVPPFYRCCFLIASYPFIDFHEDVLTFCGFHWPIPYGHVCTTCQYVLTLRCVEYIPTFSRQEYPSQDKYPLNKILAIMFLYLCFFFVYLAAFVCHTQYRKTQFWNIVLNVNFL